MLFSLLTPQKKLVDSEQIDELFVPGALAQLDILENHANLVSQLETGIVKWRQGTSWNKAVISTGVLEIFNGHASVMADVAELSDEIDTKRAAKAIEKAKAALEAGGLDDAAFRKQELKLKRAMARTQAAE